MQGSTGNGQPVDRCKGCTGAKGCSLKTISLGDTAKVLPLVRTDWLRKEVVLRHGTRESLHHAKQHCRPWRSSLNGPSNPCQLLS